MTRHYCDSCGNRIEDKEKYVLYNYYISYPYPTIPVVKRFSCSLCEYCYILITNLATKALSGDK